MLIILPEGPEDAAQVDGLLDRSFGTDRTGRTVYRLREDVLPVADLCYAAHDEDGFVGALRFWPIVAAGRPSLLLGPLAVEPADRGKGYGRALMWHGIGVARGRGHGSIILVGDPAYYKQFGFSRHLTLGLTLPGPVEEHRFLALELAPGALAGAAGPVTRPQDR